MDYQLAPIELSLFEEYRIKAKNLFHAMQAFDIDSTEYFFGETDYTLNGIECSFTYSFDYREGTFKAEFWHDEEQVASHEAPL